MMDKPAIEFGESLVSLLNETLSGYNAAVGLRFTRAEPGEFVAEIEIGPQHLQPYGLVHGGIFAGMIETLCSAGAALNVIGDGLSAVGLENSTSFLRAVRSGVLRCAARPLVMGRKSHVWEAQIHDDRGRLVATGRVRMLMLQPGAAADGATVSLDLPDHDRLSVRADVTLK